MALLDIPEEPWNNATTGTPWVADSLFPSLFLGLCFLIGMPGNGLVVWTILTKFSQRSFTIVVILNLALADLLALLTVPFWIYSFANTWVFGEVMCRILRYLVYLTVYASIFLIILMSLYRFAVVVLPSASQRWRRPCVLSWTLRAVWLSAAACACPVLIFSSSQLAEGKCKDELYYSDGQRLASNIVETSFGFAIPFTVLSICYSFVARRIRALKRRKSMKTGKLIVAVVVVGFFLSWLPYHVINLIIISALVLKHTHPDTAKALLETANVVINIHGAFAFLSSCLNPILYALAARSFCGGLWKTNFAKLFSKLHEDTEEKSARDSPLSALTL